MSNHGVFPSDPTTTVGQFRAMYGDLASVPLNPVEVGYQDYTYFSDDEIINFVVQGQGNVIRGTAFAILQSANAASLQSKMVKDYDLQVDLTKRAADLRATATQYFDLADEFDERLGLFDYFNIVDTGTLPNFNDRVGMVPDFYLRGAIWPHFVPFAGMGVVTG